MPSNRHLKPLTASRADGCDCEPSPVLNRWEMPLQGSIRYGSKRDSLAPRWEQPLQGAIRSDSGDRPPTLAEYRLKRQERQRQDRADAWALQQRAEGLQRYNSLGADSRDDAAGDEWDSERWCHPADFDQIPVEVFDAADSQDLSWQECLDAYFSGRQDSARLDGTFSDGFTVVHSDLYSEDEDTDDTDTAYDSRRHSGQWRRDPISGLKQFWSNAAGCWKTHSAGV